MGQQLSKDEMLYQQVNYGNVEGIKSLRRDGASLEWMDREGKTPLILACMRADFLPVVKTLIELGANVNAYRPGSHAGTPLHHAAKRGLDHTVRLLLSHGANALVMNDDCQTPLDMARAKGHSNVVRIIEGHIGLFYGWLRELYGPGFLEALAPQWVSRKIWVVVIPRDSRNPQNPKKFELAIYPGLQVAQPRTIIQLWKTNIEEVKFNQPDPVMVLFDKASKTRFKFLSANEGDKQQLLWFHNACRGMHQVIPPAAGNPGPAPTTNPEDLQLAMAISASIQLAMEERPPIVPTRPGSEASDMNGWGNSADNASHNGWGAPQGPSPPSKASSSSGLIEAPASSTYNGWGTPEAGPSADPIQHHQSSGSDVGTSTLNIPQGVSVIPSAPPIPDNSPDNGPIHYPSIDCSPIDLSMPAVEVQPVKSEIIEDGDASSLCVICLDAPKEVVCVPCGHVIGCMSCLNDIKAKKLGCPICRAKIDQIIKIFSV
ncbi:putative E3 ubiquitin-protein ligase XBAT34 isoform X1 [Magnolia sinica]|uniref:putative E3 ubiquitin-protein ligase XBAT34 isoform X1 n=1 Tax=Magnolia sinica TaxID=86752 RepID=UPI002657F828|nr:putative E3 ubiquitin-protein ligase XBAT34 isoform X1 [Magnolia sinica]